jgi:O-antigen/teichoic acid export membrane protein
MVPLAMRATRDTRIRLRIRRSGWRALAGRTVAFSVATVTGTAYLYGTQMLTAVVTNHYQTGLFAVSFRVFIVLGAVPTVVAAGVVPVLARAGEGDDGQLAYVLRRYLETSMIGGVWLALVISAGSGLIIGLVAGAHFHGAVAVLELQALAIIATFTASACSLGLLALHRYRELFVANGAALAVMVIATVLLAKQYGAQGAAVASICAEATAATVALVGVLRATRECHPGMRFAAKLGLASACAAPLVTQRLLVSPLRAVAVAAIYSGVILATRAVPGEVLHALPLRRHQQTRSACNDVDGRAA